MRSAVDRTFRSWYLSRTSNPIVAWKPYISLSSRFVRPNESSSFRFLSGEVVPLIQTSEETLHMKKISSISKNGDRTVFYCQDITLSKIGRIRLFVSYVRGKGLDKGTIGFVYDKKVIFEHQINYPENDLRVYSFLVGGTFIDISSSHSIFNFNREITLEIRDVDNISQMGEFVFEGSSGVVEHNQKKYLIESKPIPPNMMYLKESESGLPKEERRIKSSAYGYILSVYEIDDCTGKKEFLCALKGDYAMRNLKLICW